MTWTQPWIAQAADILAVESGLSFSPVRRPYAEAAIRRAMAKAKCRDHDLYLARLGTQPKLLGLLVNEVVIGETYFFRDSPQFEVIRKLILPDIDERRVGKSIRVWSAGCASGEEAYSLAIVLEEFQLEARGAIRATDVSSDAIETARKGIYGAWSFRGPEASEYTHYFRAARGKWTVPPRLRERVDFSVHNLAKMETSPPGEFDLILCRNVLMYFDAATVTRVAALLARSLAPGGWLVTSPADPLLTSEPGLAALTTAAGIVYKRPAPRAPAAAERAPSLPPEPTAQPQSTAASPSAGSDAEAATHVRSLMAEGAHEQALREATEASQAEPFNPEFHVLRALLLLDMNAPVEAAASARRALYLDRSIAVAHFALARALRLLGWHDVARQALWRVGALVADASEDDRLRFANASVGSLAASAGAELALLEQVEKTPR